MPLIWENVNHIYLREYKLWCESVGLIEIGPGPENDEYEAKFDSLSSLRQMVPLGERLQLTTSCFGDYENMSLIYGDRASGKSMLAIGLACARACGQDFFGFSPVGPIRTLFIDGETAGDVFRERLERTVTALKCDQRTLDRNLVLSLIYAEHSSREIDFNDDFFQRTTERLIRQHGIKLIFFDNLMSLLPGFSQSNSAATWKNFKSWLHQLERKYRVGCVLMHHSNKENQAFGTKNLERQCSTVIQVNGGSRFRQLICDPKGDILSQQIAPYSQKNGALLKVEFSKCKMSSSEIKPFGAYLERLPDNLADPFAAIKGPPWKIIGSHTTSPGLHDTEPSQFELLKLRFPTCCDEELKVINLTYSLKGIKRKDAESELDCCRDKAGKIISGLVAKQILDRHGKGPRTFYRLRPELDL